jgi:two-component system chemotaxis response regulator CheB
MAPRIRVVIVDDSSICRAALRVALSSDPEVDVVGEARDGVEATSLIRELKPNLITLDLFMPRMGGLEVIEWVMKNLPTPILVVTDRPRVDGVDMTFESLARGALELLPKATAWQPGSREAKALVDRVKAVARSASPEARRPASAPTTTRSRHRPPSWSPSVVALGASTGGPNALARVLKDLRTLNAPPIVLVQHMDALFHESFAIWLKKQCGLPVNVASDGAQLKAGEVLVAPPGGDMMVTSANKVKVIPGRPGALHVPSVDTLFHSVADVFGSTGVGVLLTGMGADGAQGLKSMFDRGALTFAQDRESSVIYGMPAAAVDLKAVEEVLPLNSVAGRLNELWAARQLDSPLGASTPSPPPDGSNGRGKVLMVDDSAVVLEAGRLALEDAGFSVVTLDNPLTVAGAVRRERPDLVLIDVNMPAVTGDIVAQIVNQHGITSKIKVVLYSDISESELQARAKKCGARGYIQKTGDEDELIRQVSEFMQMS